jgi:hypothetical protein
VLAAFTWGRSRTASDGALLSSLPCSAPRHLFSGQSRHLNYRTDDLPIPLDANIPAGAQFVSSERPTFWFDKHN